MKCKCGRAVVTSPMNPKVKLCTGCHDWKANCTCASIKCTPCKGRGFDKATDLTCAACNGTGVTE